MTSRGNLEVAVECYHRTKTSPSFPEAAAAPCLQKKTLLVHSAPHHLRVVQTATSMAVVGRSEHQRATFPVQAAEAALQIQQTSTCLRVLLWWTRQIPSCYRVRSMRVYLLESDLPKDMLRAKVTSHVHSESPLHY